VVGESVGFGVGSGEELIAGPYHPNFRELVLSRIWKNRFIKIPSNKDSILKITVNPTEINHAIGFGGENKKELLKRFTSVDFIQDKQIDKNSYHVDYL
jgi:hypothetical protein